MVRGERSTQRLHWSVEEAMPALTMTLWVQDLGGGSRCDVVETQGNWSEKCSLDGGLNRCDMLEHVTDEGLLPVEERRKWSLDVKSAPGGSA